MSQTVKTYPLFANLMTATIPTAFVPSVEDNAVEYINVWDNNDAEPLFVTSGCVYAIDTEGTLFYAPRYQSDGHFDVEEMTEVDYYDIEEEEDLQQVRDTLVAEYTRLGWYYQK